MAVLSSDGSSDGCSSDLAEFGGLFSEGLLAFDGEGRISAVNQSELNLLGHIRGGLLGQRVEDFFDCSLDVLLARASAHATDSWPLRTRDGRHLFAVLRGQPRNVPMPVGPSLRAISHRQSVVWGKSGNIR